MYKTTRSIIILMLLACEPIIIYSIEPFTVGTAAVAGGALLLGLGKSAYCLVNECCREPWTKYNLSGIERALNNGLIGQHLVNKIVPRTIRAHVNKKEPEKALVLSFHGWTGSGKNYVADMIANHLYNKGLNSKYVHRYIPGIDFPHANEIYKYKNQLRKEIEKYTNHCERSMFIFDEMEKLPPGLADVLKPYLDHIPNIKGVDYRKNIFIFLSNTVGDGINREALRNFKNGLTRESLTSKHMEKILSIGSFNVQGGLKDSDLILAGLVDFFVPFLPMEKCHVKECIRAEIRRRDETIYEDVVNKVAEELEYFPKNSGLFSSTGCKQVAKKLDAFL